MERYDAPTVRSLRQPKEGCLLRTWLSWFDASLFGVDGIYADVNGGWFDGKYAMSTGVLRQGSSGLLAAGLKNAGAVRAARHDSRCIYVQPPLGLLFWGSLDEGPDEANFETTVMLPDGKAGSTSTVRCRASQNHVSVC